MRKRHCIEDTIRDFCAAGLEQKFANHASPDGLKVDFHESCPFKRVGSRKPYLAGEKKLKERASHHLYMKTLVS